MKSEISDSANSHGFHLRIRSLAAMTAQSGTLQRMLRPHSAHDFFRLSDQLQAYEIASLLNLYSSYHTVDRDSFFMYPQKSNVAFSLLNLQTKSPARPLGAYNSCRFCAVLGWQTGLQSLPFK